MAKLTPQQILENRKRIQADALILKELWQDSFPPELPPPPDWELKNAVRRLAIADLEEGIQSYLVILSKGEGEPSTKNALNYICGTAWGITEKDNPDTTFHPTARRQRKAQRDMDSPQWDGEAFATTTPSDRQSIVAENVAKKKAAKQ
jgi:hypothetical protein